MLNISFIKIHDVNLVKMSYDGPPKVPILPDFILSQRFPLCQSLWKISSSSLRAWDQLIQSSVLLWKSRVQLHFGSHPNHCALLKLPLYKVWSEFTNYWLSVLLKERKKNATRLQALERRLRRLDRNLRENRSVIFRLKSIRKQSKTFKLILFEF